MLKNKHIRFFFLVKCCLLAPLGGQIFAQVSWKINNDALCFAEHKSGKLRGKRGLFILKLNPEKLDFHMIPATEHHRRRRPLDQWCIEKKLLAGINAGLFFQDERLGNDNHLLSAGFMKNYGHINQKNRNNYALWIAFNPRKPGLEPFRIYDLAYETKANPEEDYHSVIQGNTLMNSRRKICWEKDDRKFSMALLGTDSEGQVYFFFCPEPAHPVDIAEIIRADFPSMQALVYLEGGHLSSFCLRYKDLDIRENGISPADFLRKGKKKMPAIPNVIGVSLKNGMD